MRNESIQSIHKPRVILLSISIPIILAAVCILYFSSGTPSSAASSLSFTVDVGDLVGLTIHNTARYGIDEEGGQDYAQLMPSGGHTIHLLSDRNRQPQVSTVALFHQLKCLEIYHREYSQKPRREPTSLLRHCLNYLRQSILCHADTRLESIKNEQVQANKEYETVCRDWTRVYEAAENNYAEYQKEQAKI
ncbi:hypothetical protein DFH09DRAFT_1053828 [Mycena vulgaris]|nr:hypothetical protein DFH09DRAFT_1053828 [Mycena vulgaris]